jgi:hypothetical protein
MDKFKRLQQLEWKLDNEDLTDGEFERINSEWNKLQDETESIRSAAKAERELARKELQEAQELDKILSLTEDEVDKMYEKACIEYQDVNGMSFKAWYEQSQRYYTIDNNYNVHSKARSPNTVEIVPCHTLAHAKYRILTLIKTKFNDHAKRGYDFAWDIDSETNI